MITLAEVARYLEIRWDSVNEIIGDDLQSWFAKTKLRSLKPTAIHKVDLGKKDKFPTIVMDLDRGTIVFVSDGKGKKLHAPF